MNLRVIYVLTVILLLISLNLSCAEHSENENYKFIIITPIDFIEKLKPLVGHKEYYGITTKIVTLNDIYDGVYFKIKGRDNPEKVKYFIKEAKESWDINYVMLVGGRDEMPVRYIPHMWKFFSFFISDLYYADIYDENLNFCSWDTNNNSVFGELAYGRMIDFVDLYPDVYVGRLLCDTPLEVEYMVNNIIDYEKNTYGQDWFNNLVVCGGNSKPTILDIIYGKPYGGEIVYEGEYIGNKVIDTMRDFNPIKLYTSTFTLTRKNINNAINDGTGFILFSGHGSPAVWGTYSLLGILPAPFPFGYTIFDTKNIENGNNLSIAIFNACSCGDFSSISPLAWDIIIKGGAIASLACTGESVSMPSSLCTETLSGSVTVKFFETYAKGNDILGNVHGETLIDYLNEDAGKYSFSNETSYECMKYWILLGDPTLKIGGYQQF